MTQRDHSIPARGQGLTRGKGNFLRWHLRLVCSRMKRGQEGRGTETREETQGERVPGREAAMGAGCPVVTRAMSLGRASSMNTGCIPAAEAPSSAHPPRLTSWLPAAGKGSSHKQEGLSQPSPRLWNSMCGLRNRQTKTPHPILRNLIC